MIQAVTGTHMPIQYATISLLIISMPINASYSLHLCINHGLLCKSPFRIPHNYSLRHKKKL